MTVALRLPLTRCFLLCVCEPLPPPLCVRVRVRVSFQEYLVELQALLRSLSETDFKLNSPEFWPAAYYNLPQQERCLEVQSMRAHTNTRAGTHTHTTVDEGHGDPSPPNSYTSAKPAHWNAHRCSMFGDEIMFFMFVHILILHGANKETAKFISKLFLISFFLFVPETFRKLKHYFLLLLMCVLLSAHFFNESLINIQHYTKSLKRIFSLAVRSVSKPLS